jgi:hypothetical protein
LVVSIVFVASTVLAGWVSMGDIAAYPMMAAIITMMAMLATNMALLIAVFGLFLLEDIFIFHQEGLSYM